jgi:hypothetical protein
LAIRKQMYKVEGIEEITLWYEPASGLFYVYGKHDSEFITNSPATAWITYIEKIEAHILKKLQKELKDEVRRSGTNRPVQIPSIQEREVSGNEFNIPRS